MPVLILTARDSWREKVEGIDAGADDYLGKPFATEELLARLRAVLRRAAGRAGSLLRHGSLELDPGTVRVALDGVAVPLTPMEYRVLEVIVGRLRRKLGRDRIETVRGLGYRLGAVA